MLGFLYIATLLLLTVWYDELGYLGVTCNPPNFSILKRKKRKVYHFFPCCLSVVDWATALFHAIFTPGARLIEQLFT